MLSLSAIWLAAVAVCWLPVVENGPQQVTDNTLKLFERAGIGLPEFVVSMGVDKIVFWSLLIPGCILAVGWVQVGLGGLARYFEARKLGVSAEALNSSAKFRIELRAVTALLHKEGDLSGIHGPAEQNNAQFVFDLRAVNFGQSPSILTDWQFFLILQNHDKIPLQSLPEINGLAMTCNRHVPRENFIWNRTGEDPIVSGGAKNGTAVLEIPEINRSSKIFEALKDRHARQFVEIECRQADTRMVNTRIGFRYRG